MAAEVCVGQRYQPFFFVQVADIKPEECQDLADIAFVDKAEAVELREAWFGLPVFEVAYPIVRHIVCRIFLFFYDALAESFDIANGQVPSFAFCAETLTSFGTRRQGQHWERLRLALRYGRRKLAVLSTGIQFCSEIRHTRLSILNDLPSLLQLTCGKLVGIPTTISPMTC